MGDRCKTGKNPSADNEIVRDLPDNVLQSLKFLGIY